MFNKMQMSPHEPSLLERLHLAADKFLGDKVSVKKGRKKKKSTKRGKGK